MMEPLASKTGPVPFLNPQVGERWRTWCSASLGSSGASIVEAEMEDWSGFVPPSRELVIHALLPGAEPACASRDLGDGRRDTLVRAGQICVTPPSQSGRWAWRGRFRDLNLVIPGKLLARAAGDAGLGRIPDLMPLAREPQEDAFIETVVRRLGDVGREQVQLCCAAEADHMVALMAYWVLRRAEPVVAPPRGGLSTFATRRVRDYIEDNLARDLSVGELADLVELSTPYFSHAFRTSFGEAPYRYILRRRCTRACALLKRHDTLIDIALAVGFANQSHFTTAFRRLVGVTPAAWRRSHRA